MKKRETVTLQQRDFVAAYLSLNCDFESTCRAKKVNRNTAQRWFKDARFLEHLNKRQAIIASIADITAAEVIGTLVSQMRADIADIFPDNPVLRKASAAGVSHLIKKLKVTTRKNGDEHIEIELVDSNKAAVQLSKLMALETRDDEMERARLAIRAVMAMKGCSALEAIHIVAPHVPAVLKLRSEFDTEPTIEIDPGKKMQ